MSVYTRYCFSAKTGKLHGENVHSLWLRCPHGRSGQWERTGLPVAERVLSAELRGEITPGISLSDSSAGRFHLLSLVLFLDYFQKKRKKKLGGGFLDRGGKNLVSDCLQLPPSISSPAVETTQIDLFYTLLNPNASYVKAVY